ncbi:protein kinase-like protein [Klebsiella pneumoniae subsp. ozaenae]|uniref:Protein kinase-like protein n=1 Tax=Klebsiella pneumoniae subsp. ozaenae TaxID=574 RepID=A0A377ZH39_KLEPO|nr:protein kinase-like protein [Klebsiella pneumoniae subsp. ozaenae]
MWQAISTLLRDWHTEDAEIELKTELPVERSIPPGIYASAGKITS